MKAFAFDLDDTLLRDDRSVSLYTLDTLNRLRAEGMIAIPASGRTRKSMQPFLELLGFRGIFIACNGAEIWRTGSDRPLLRLFIPDHTYLEIIRFGEANRAYMQAYDSEGFYFNRECDFARSYAAVSMLHGVCAGDLSRLANGERSKILMIDTEAKISGMYRDALCRFSGKVAVSCSKPIYLEFNPLHATKGEALHFVADYLGIGMQDIAAFGDGINDLPMLNAAGISVAVANAREEVRRACRFVCGSNQEDGVAHFLNEYVPVR